MDKKDIYEHLAKIYLDASSKKKKKNKKYSKVFKNLFFSSAVLIFVFASFLFSHLNKNKPLNSEIALIFSSDLVKINFNFDPAKKETYSLNLNRLDLTKYKALGFSVKKSNYQDDISLRVEFTNAFKERSEAYFRDISSSKWNDYQVNLADFKNIRDWSRMLVLAFIVEEWNTKGKKGVVYIDNIRLLK